VPVPGAANRFAERENNIVHWSEFDRVGHLAALEAPDLLVEDVRTFFRGMRYPRLSGADPGGAG
jgi:epoxide hydrolase